MHSALKKCIDGKIKLSRDQEDFVNSCFIPKFTRRNEILVSEGEVAKHIYLVVKGCLRIFITGNDGRESTRFLVLEGHMGTAFPSFVLKQPSSASIQSLGPCELLMTSYNDLQQLYKNIPGWETMARIGLELEYIASIQRIESFITMNAKTRYDTLLKNNPEIIKKIPAKVIADYLGISQETLSRIKSKK